MKAIVVGCLAGVAVTVTVYVGMLLEHLDGDSFKLVERSDSKPVHSFGLRRASAVGSCDRGGSRIDLLV